MNLSTPVMFSLPGLNENTDTNNSGFNSPSGEESKTMEAYKIAPVFWMMFFIIVGYVGLRYVMDES